LAASFCKISAFLEKTLQEIALHGLGSLAPIEEGLLVALKEDGALLLERLIQDCILQASNPTLEPGELNYGFRELTVLTLLGPILIKRSYCYNETLGRGRFPADEALWLHNGYSPENRFRPYYGSLLCCLFVRLWLFVTIRRCFRQHC
jgi:hypothetical protein